MFSSIVRTNDASIIDLKKCKCFSCVQYCLVVLLFLGTLGSMPPDHRPENRFVGGTFSCSGSNFQVIFWGFVYGFMTRHVEHVHKGWLLVLYVCLLCLCLLTHESIQCLYSLSSMDMYILNFFLLHLEQMECFFFNFKS